MSDIQIAYTIKAPVKKVWQALTSAEVAEQWGAGPAIVDATVGGKFSYWDGDIHGIFTKLVPEKLIDQDWYGHDNPTWKYNVTFTLDGSEKTTHISILYSGEILDEKKDIKDWYEYYLEPIKSLLEK